MSSSGSFRIGWRRRGTPGFGRAYTELAYRPMLELLAYLRANGFKTYIVSGGGGEFIWNKVFAFEK
jgi:phosphoserine phosphatase